jgi:beta-glucosidase
MRIELRNCLNHNEPSICVLGFKTIMSSRTFVASVKSSATCTPLSDSWRTFRYLLSATIYTLVIVCVAPAVALSSAAMAASLSRKGSIEPAIISLQSSRSQCPWTSRSMQLQSTPDKLAATVLAKMTLAEKVSFVVLSNKHGYENTNTGIPKLCIPTLTLSDGPNGLAYSMTGVTQLPASIGVAASFDPSLAYNYGSVLGQEAKGKGVDVLQGPNLNLARVPEDGRIFEGYGEDPYLASELGVADIQGIQSTGTMANAKHYTGYNQETARLLINEKIPTRALEELYLAPFQAAVEQGHVASLMCAYGSLNGINDCSDSSLYRTLYADWGFNGFVRSDLDAVPNIPDAFNAGLSMVKPAKPSQLIKAVQTKQMSSKALNTAVLRILSNMFAYGLIGSKKGGSLKATVTSKAHSTTALQAAEESMVLLKNNGTLPLSQNEGSIAVIGKYARRGASHLGGGSANVEPNSFATPLSALRAMLGNHTQVMYDTGVPANNPLPDIPWTAYTSGQPLTLVPSPSPFEDMLDSAAAASGPKSGTSDIRIALQPDVSPAVATANRPLGNEPNWMNWEAAITPPESGLYDISLTNNGDCWLKVNGKPLLSFNGLHNHSTWDTTIQMAAGRQYHVQLQWFQTGSQRPLIGWKDVSPAINRAVAVAKKAKIAVVFAGDYNSEGLDRPNSYLPGAQDQLIEAVAAVNPRTIVVLNTGGAVSMPWINHVASVVEAWYPGQADGTATSAALFGMIDPSGKLPITFPPSNSTSFTGGTKQWPGKDGVVDYDEGLDIGYRQYTPTGEKPLFPFGFGLSYTSFQLGQPIETATAGTIQISVPVTNTGQQTGAEVVQCYIQYPQGSGEPPRQLRAFDRVNLAPGQTENATLSLDSAAFQVYTDGKFSAPAGNFTAWIGTSSEDLPYSLTVHP